MVTVNGRDLDIAGKTLSEYLATANYDNRRIVVEINLEIVPKTQYDSTVLKDQDTVEVVSFIGGG
ncbi:MAG: sulfur carrier protein ThiS [Treponema sp.]|nr:sulfur carrier protein ThiS [Treponema sp.]